MKLFVLFAPKFLDWPAAIARSLQKREPGTELLAVASNPYAYNYIRNTDLPFARLDSLEVLERKWLETPFDEKRLQALEHRLGPDALRRIVIADRNVGAGYVAGAQQMQSEMARRCRDNDTLRRYVTGLLTYCFEILEKEKPDAVFLYAVAGAFAVAMGETAKLLGVPFMRLQHTRFQDCTILDTSVIGLFDPVAETYRAALKSPSMVQEHLDTAKKWIGDFRGRKMETVAGYATFNRAARRQAFSPVNVIRKTAITAAREILYPWKHGRKPLRTNNAVAQVLECFVPALRYHLSRIAGPFFNPEKLGDRPFIYFPLHLDPEASTMVISPLHTNQFAIIEALSKAAPLSMDIVVKEHQTMLGNRPYGFYKALSRLPGVRLISPFADSLDLIRKAALTATITGTAAWEAMLLQKPALIIGESPFRAIDAGFAYCTDLASLGPAISKAMSMPPASDTQLETYIASILHESFNFPSGIFWGKVTPETVAAHPQIADQVADRIIALTRQEKARAAGKLRAAV